MAPIGFVIVLTLMWVLAWGTVSVANVVGGLAVAVLLITFAPDTWPRSATVRVRPLAIARFVVYVLSEAVIANLHIVRQVLVASPKLSTGVVGIPLPQVTDGLLTIIANTIALTPGTMPIEVDHGAEPLVLYVHFLQLDDVEAGRRSIQKLARFVYKAFATTEAIEAFEASCVPPSEAQR